MMFNFFARSKARSTRRERGRKSLQRFSSRLVGFEPLESRQLLSADATTVLSFNIPADVASQGVYAGLYSNTSSLYLDPVSHQFESFSKLTGSVPLFTLAAATQNHQPASDAPVNFQLTVPLTQDVVSGELFIFIGTPATGLVYASSSVAAPKAAMSPALGTAGDNFAQFEFDYDTTAGLDIDISAVDSTGFPFTLVYPTSAGLSFPLTTLGITLNQTDLNHNFEFAFSADGQYANYPEFEQCATFATMLSPNDLQVVAPQDILAAEDAPPTINAPVVNTGDANSHLATDCDYYYRITAFSNNEIDNSGGRLGETLLSDYENVAASSLIGHSSITLSWDPYYDPNTAGYNIYRYSTADGATPTDDTVYNLIAQLYGVTTTSYTDEGAIPQAQQTSVATATNYGFNPLSEYYTAELQAFFAHYATPNSFSLHRNGALWVGNTVTYTPAASWNTTGASYTVLQLTAQNSVTGTSIQQGDVLNIYAPFFATNTSYLGMQLPVMPSWMQVQGNLYESPAQMVFGCDTVFASNAYDPDVAGNGDLAGALGAIENSIVSALNRGIATNYAIPPDNWAAFPQMLSAPIVATDSASQVTATTTYFYAVSAVNVYGETTLGLEVSATLEAGQSATLTWANGANAAPAIGYNIYRGTSVNNLTLYKTLGGQQASYTDTGASSSGGSAPTFQYFTPGTTSNWYAALVQTNSTVDPVNGVSINGLSYGFPYSDQGGVSTNICFAPNNIPATININLGTISGPSFVTQSLADAVAGTDYQQTLVVSGPGTGTYFDRFDSQLPNWLSLDSDTGVLSGKAPATAGSISTFNIMATNSAGSVVMPFSVTVDAASQAPLSLAGSSNNTLTAGTTDVGLSFTMQVQVTGGSGNYSMTLAPHTALPTGMVINGLDTGLTSTNGMISLAGSTTSSFTAEDVGILVTISDVDSPAIGSLTATLYIQVNPVLQITSSSLPDAAQGTAYWQPLTTNSASPGVQFAVQTGSSLPAGLTLTPWGILTGTPTESGTFSFTVTATDIAGGTATQTFNDFVIDANAAAAITFATTTLPVTAPAASYNETLLVSGGQGSLSFALVNGALPNGLSFTTETDGTPCISGTVNAALGVYPFTIRATDSVGNAEYQAYQLVINGVTASTQNLAANATSLVINGFGFDMATPSNNVVTLSSGTVHSVTTVSSTQLLVTLDNSSGLPTTGALSATVATGTLPSQSAQVATVVNSSTPAVTANTGALAANATTLVIHGSGFDTDSINGSNLVTLSSGTVQSVTANSSTQLTVTLSGALTLGALTATVTTDGVASSNVQVATVVAASTPIIDLSTNVLFNNITTLVLYGSGFEPGTGTAPSVSLSCSNGAVTSGTVTVNSDNQLTISNVNLSNGSGELNAVVAIDGVSSSLTPIGTLQSASTPIIGMPAGTNFWSNATTLIINGWGFTSGSTATLTGNYSATGPHAITGFTTAYNTTNQITLSDLELPNVIPQVIMHDTGSGYTSAPTVTLSGGGATTQATCVAVLNTSGQVIGVTLTSLGSGYTSAPTITFSGGGYTTEASADVSIETLMSLMVEVADPTNGTSNQPVVANIQAGTSNNAPTITTSESVLSTNVATLTITGTNFDTGGTNYVKLYTDGGATALPIATIASLASNMGIQNVVANSSTQLTVTLAGPLPLGDLYASVVTDGLPMSSPPVMIGTVNPLSITSATTTLSQSPAVLVIQGTGFICDGVNTVTLFTGNSQTQLPANQIASVVADSDTQLTVIINNATALPAGPLAATVVVAGVSSGTPVQVAEVVASGPLLDLSTMNLAATAGTLIIQGANLTGATSVTLSTIAGVLADAVTSFSVNNDGTQVIVTLNSATPLPTGQLYATITTPVATSNTVQVATVTSTAAPTVNVNTNSLAATATQLVITGTNFDTTGGGVNIVTLTSGTTQVSAVQSVTVNSSTQLTVNLSDTLPLGPLTATVTTDGLSSSATQVANVVDVSVPTIVTNTANVLTTATSLTIQGTGFDANSGASNVVTLSSGTVASVTVSSSTQLIVTLSSAAQPLSAGPLMATVTVNGLSSASMQVATAVAEPVITASTAAWSAASPTLTIQGTGFDPTDANNSVTLSSGAGVVTSATSRQIVIHLTQAPTAGPLSAQVTVNGFASAMTSVATALPSVTASAADLPFLAETLTIDGVGFDPIAAHNHVTLSSGTAAIVSATSTQLVVHLATHPRFGALVATVVVNGAASSAQVATVTTHMLAAIGSALAVTTTTETITSGTVTPVRVVSPPLPPISGTSLPPGVATPGTAMPIIYGGSGIGKDSVEMAEVGLNAPQITGAETIGRDAVQGDGPVSITASTPVIVPVQTSATTLEHSVTIVWTVTNEDGVDSTSLRIDGATVAASSITSSTSGATTTYTYTGAHEIGDHTYTIGATGISGMTAEPIQGRFTVKPAEPASSDAEATGNDSNATHSGRVLETDNIDSSPSTVDEAGAHGWKANMIIAGSTALGAITWWPWRKRRHTHTSQRSR